MNELTYERPAYYSSVKLFSEQEGAMADSREHLKVSGDSHPRRQQVCTLRQKELEVKMLSVSYSDTPEKLQDLSIVLDHNTLIAELEHNAKYLK
jgi:hypothetical protein